MRAEAAGLGVDTEHNAATLLRVVGCPSRFPHGCASRCHGQILELSLSQPVLDILVSVKLLSLPRYPNITWLCSCAQETWKDSNSVSCGRYPSLGIKPRHCFAVKLAQNSDEQVSDCLPIRSWGTGCSSSPKRPLIVQTRRERSHA